MTKKPQTSKDAAEKLVKNIRRKTRQTYSAEEKIRIVLAGLRGEESSRLPLGRARPWQRTSCKDRLWRAGGNGACPGRASVLRDFPLSPRLCLSAVMFGLPAIQVHARPGPCATTWVSVIWLCSADPAQPRCCGDGEDRDLLPQSVPAHADDVADSTHRCKLHRAFSFRRKTCAGVVRTWP